LSTSGSYNFALDRDTLIKRAMHLANVVNLNQTPRADDNAFAVVMLQSMMKLWQAEGIQLWNRRRAYLFPAYQDKEYSLSSTTAEHATNSYVNTTLSAAEALGQTILSVTSSTGMTAADYVGIELDDGTRQWTTIVSVDSATQITVTATLTAAAASGATVVVYTTKIADRPLRILDMNTYDLNNTVAIEMNQIGYDEYNSIPIKTTDGKPINYHYEKLLGAGTVSLFPRPDDVDVILEFTYHEAIEDVDSSTDSLDYPTEWTMPLIYGLAVELCVAYGKFQELQVIKPMADNYKNIVRDFDSDEAELYILPENYQ